MKPIEEFVKWFNKFARFENPYDIHMIPELFHAYSNSLINFADLGNYVADGSEPLDLIYGKGLERDPLGRLVKHGLVSMKNVEDNWLSYSSVLQHFSDYFHDFCEIILPHFITTETGEFVYFAEDGTVEYSKKFTGMLYDGNVTEAMSAISYPFYCVCNDIWEICTGKITEKLANRIDSIINLFDKGAIVHHLGGKIKPKTVYDLVKVDDIDIYFDDDLLIPFNSTKTFWHNSRPKSGYFYIGKSADVDMDHILKSQEFPKNMLHVPVIEDNMVTVSDPIFLANVNSDEEMLMMKMETGYDLKKVSFDDLIYNQDYLSNAAKRLGLRDNFNL